MRRVHRNGITLSASVSCMDLLRLADSLDKVHESGAAFLHFDVVDGEFNNCFILGSPTLEQMRTYTNLPIEVHLAVNHPEKYFRQYIDAGADYVAFHAETQGPDETARLCENIVEMGAAPILAFRVETVPDRSYAPALKAVEWVLKLLVQPGYSGQTLTSGAMDALRALRALLDDVAPGTGIQADGNVNLDTIPAIVAAGADILTGGTSGLFRTPDVAANARAMLTKAHGPRA